MKTQKLFLVVLCTSFSLNLASQEQKVRYDNYHVFKLTPKTEEAVKFLQDMASNFSEFSFWTTTHAVNFDVDIMVPPHQVERFQNMSKSEDFTVKPFIQNVQQLIDNERPKTRAYTGFGWSDYHSLAEIQAWLKQLSHDHPDTVTLLNAGQSYEGRDILGIKLSFAPGNEKKSVFIEGNIHGREWISSAVVTYIINELLTNHDPYIRDLAITRDWYIFPVTNPDGFVYSHTKNRLWSKTRVPYGIAYGADPNRNWGYMWNQGGSSSIPFSDSYHGPKPFSEPCTKHLSTFISSIGHDLQAYISFHSYSQLLLIPYGHTGFEHPANTEDLLTVGAEAMKSLARRYGTRYRTGTIAEMVYVASGGSMDWVNANFHTPITYTYKLRDTGRYGFLLPADQIIPTGEETLDSLVTMFEEFDKILN